MTLPASSSPRLNKTGPAPDARIPFRSQWRTALGWLVVAAALGVGLRSLMIWPNESFNYLYWLHAHSHVVLLGWAFNALLAGVWAEFLPADRVRTYHRWWLGLQVAVGGMLLFFPIQGYAAGSILFSTLHAVLSYGIGLKLWRDLQEDQTLSAALLRWGIGLLFLSTLGPYAVGALRAKGLAHTNAYNLAIYFYLHFLYNGWFLFGVLALLTRQLERWNLPLPTRTGRLWLAAWVVSCLSSYSLSALWTQPPTVVWALGFFSGALQLVAGGWLARWLWQRRAVFRQRLQPWPFALYRLAWLAFVVKIGLQGVSAFPWAAEWAYVQRPIVIAYLHLVFIGVVSFFLIGKAVQDGYLTHSTLSLKAGIGFFVAMELWLVAEPLFNRIADRSVPYYYPGLWLVSVGLWLSFLGLWVAQMRTTNQAKSFIPPT